MESKLKIRGFFNFAVFGRGSLGDLVVTLMGSRAACEAMHTRGTWWQWGWGIHCSVDVHEENGTFRRKGNSLFIVQSESQGNLLILLLEFSGSLIMKEVKKTTEMSLNPKSQEKGTKKSKYLKMQKNPPPPPPKKKKKKKGGQFSGLQAVPNQHQ